MAYSNSRNTIRNPRRDVSVVVPKMAYSYFGWIHCRKNLFVSVVIPKMAYSYINEAEQITGLKVSVVIPKMANSYIFWRKYGFYR